MHTVFERTWSPLDQQNSEPHRNICTHSYSDWARKRALHCKLLAKVHTCDDDNTKTPEQSTQFALCCEHVFSTCARWFERLSLPGYLPNVYECTQIAT